jgi:hypothetical protein
VAWVCERNTPAERPPLSVKFVPSSTDRGCHVVSVMEPYGRNLDFLDWSRYFIFQVAPQKLAITSPTSGGRSVGIVRSRTQTMELSLVFFYLRNKQDKRRLYTSRNKWCDVVAQKSRVGGRGSGSVVWAPLTVPRRSAAQTTTQQQADLLRLAADRSNKRTRPCSPLGIVSVIWTLWSIDNALDFNWGGSSSRHWLGYRESITRNYVIFFSFSRLLPEVLVLNIGWIPGILHEGLRDFPQFL